MYEAKKASIPTTHAAGKFDKIAVLSRDEIGSIVKSMEESIGKFNRLYQNPIIGDSELRAIKDVIESIIINLEKAYAKRLISTAEEQIEKYKQSRF